MTVGTIDVTRDTDGDGLVDWVEYALGLEPAMRSAVLPRSEIETIGGIPFLTLRVSRSPMLPLDTTLSIQSSGDLLQWAPGTILTDSATEFKVRDTVPAPSASARFMRLQVTRQTASP